MPSKNAIVLLSGGLDSATVLAIAQSQQFTVHALSFRYGQRHEHEIQSARRIAERHGGTITAHSRTNQGSTFVIILPEHREYAGEVISAV